ncbi:SDR family NAD(P)-dependent oxidoreductase [Exilibacterium tricleocarpae]|uniref:SDR family NAD(P)-dependent oxidoreductase n=1 Tax=Exilibacterium tricleocarpae TaxID=2591008 RepID=A0A545T0L6_9GAMM|nr:SDR family NAD(P)-dependent oxidoreductase [Exilibacterium tricleocarpae]TQV70762.1 SDR family NAD(P)-dependent oxidoreductase [Exilibacterium tricleocarpae]
MSNYKGKTAVISGGAEGIGLAIGRALGQQGMNVVLADIDTAQLAVAQEQLSAEQIPVLTLPLDVAVESQWQEVARQTLAHFGKVHMLVNNAGVGGIPGNAEHTDEAGWRWTIDVNLMGVVYGAQTFIPLLKQQGEGGWVINVASMAGMAGTPFAGPYTATKHAVVALSEAWREELKSREIKVAVLCPAFVKTRIHQSHRNRQARYAPDQPPSEKQMKMASGAAVAVENGIDVNIIGKRVVEALDQGEFYIFSHPNYRPITQQRAAAIDAAFERAAKSPLLQHIVDQEIVTF